MSVKRRRGQHDQVPEFLRDIGRASRILPIDENLLEQAGAIHAAERSRSKDVGMVDAIILAHAAAEGATLVTTDRGLARNRQGVKVRVVGGQ